MLQVEAFSEEGLPQTLFSQIDLTIEPHEIQRCSKAPFRFSIENLQEDGYLTLKFNGFYGETDLVLPLDAMMPDEYEIEAVYNPST